MKLQEILYPVLVVTRTEEETAEIQATYLEKNKEISFCAGTLKLAKLQTSNWLP